MTNQTIKRSALSLMLCAGCITLMAQQRVTGTVVDETGNPMIGVTVNVDGKPVAVTDVDGHFVLPNVKPQSQVKVSYIGYQSQTIKVGHQSNLNVTMTENAGDLNEVVVVGYNTIRKSDLTGSVGSVNNTKLNEKGAVSVLENLQGSVAGVNITKTDSRAGGGFNIEIRGKNSINGNQSPLYVVDGIICSNIDFLNPQDIERIDVLKDASSTAIYGSRATAGVVMVTTKSGSTVGKRKLKPTVSYDGYVGIIKSARMPDFMTADEWYQYRFFKFNTYAGGLQQGGQPTLINTDVNRCLLLDRSTGIYRMKELLENGKTYNWRDFVLQDGKQQNHYIAVSGSTDRLNYHIGLGYEDEKGIYKNDEQKKFVIKGSLDGKILSWLDAGFNMNLSRIDHDYASNTAVSTAFYMNAFCQPYQEDGSIWTKPGAKEALGTDEYQFTSSVSPLYWIDNEKSNTLSWMALGNVYLQATPLKGLVLKSTFSPQFTYNRFGYYQGPSPDDTSRQNEARRTSGQGFSYTWDNMVTYDRMFGKDHHLNLMGLISYTYADSESEKLYYNNVLEGTYWWNVGTTNQGYNYTSSGSGYSESRLMSYALRANYTLMNKYMATATIRWDGSSRFAEGNRWGSFPSFALAWRASEESFIKDNAKWISNLKLRLSYGVTGNNNVSNYATRLAVAGPVYYPFGSTYVQGLYPNGLVDYGLKWEKSHEINLGLDFGFLNERIRGSVDVYNKKSTDLLYSERLPLESGGISLTTNVGSVRNRGVEFELTTENIVSRNWRWTTSLTFAHNQNKVLEINGTGDLYSGSDTGNLFIGKSYNNVYGYEWVGIVSDRNMVVPDNEIARLKGFTPGTTVREVDYYNKCYNLNEGNPIILDRNGDGRYSNEDKKVYKSDPDWTGSFTSNLSWKSWDFSFSLYAKQGYTVYSNFLNTYLNLNDRGRQKLSADWYIPAGTMIDCDGVRPDGTFINPVYQETTHYGTYPFPNNGQSNSGLGTENWNGHTNCYANASFVKMKHITLGYTLPRRLSDKFACSLLRVYLTVTNPFVITGYKGYDPEWATASSSNDGPSTVTWQLGLNVKF